MVASFLKGKIKVVRLYTKCPFFPGHHKLLEKMTVILSYVPGCQQPRCKHRFRIVVWKQETGMYASSIRFLFFFIIAGDEVLAGFGDKGF